jgi:hypothetical protein
MHNGAKMLSSCNCMHWLIYRLSYYWTCHWENAQMVATTKNKKFYNHFTLRLFYREETNFTIPWLRLVFPIILKDRLMRLQSVHSVNSLEALLLTVDDADSICIYSNIWSRWHHVHENKQQSQAFAHPWILYETQVFTEMLKFAKFKC